MLTLSKIAKELGVCKATVSLVLNGKAKENRISEATIQKVSAYCRERNYMPNIHASRMRQEVVQNIMVLLNASGSNFGEESTFIDYNVNRILEGVSAKAEECGYSVTLRRFYDNMDPQKLFNCFRNREVDGMIYYGLDIPEEWLKVINAEKSRIVGVGITPGKVPCVNVDNYSISCELTRHLLANGRKTFFYLKGTEASHPSRERFRGFTDTLRAAGISFDPDTMSRNGQFSEKQGRAITAELIATGKLPDTIVCANDKMAVGAISALAEANIQVPETVAVAGADNIALGRYLSPGLTTFDNCAGDLGKSAAELLIKLIRAVGNTDDILLPSTLIIRGSTA